MEINKILQTGREALLKNGIDPREARLFLAFVLKIKSEELIKFKECSESEFKQYIQIINRRCAGEPYAYIVGNKEFMKLNFKVTEDVLIPREDTEILVQEVIERLQKFVTQAKKRVKILDMCTGSGCIAISLAKYIENSEVTAVDISEKALKIAKENAIMNDVKVIFIKSDLFENLQTNIYESSKKEDCMAENGLNKIQKFDLIVSNPPYIKKDVIHNLQAEVKREPILALDGGKSGLEFYEKITSQAGTFLKENGILAFEIGFDQGTEVKEIMKKNGFENVIIIKDISKNDRVVIGEKI